MSRETVRIGDEEVIVGDFLWGEMSRPTNVEFRAYIIEGTTKKFDNGSAFTITDALLPSTFTGGIGYATYTFPAYALDKEVRLEAKPIGFGAEVPESMKTPEEDSRYVVTDFQNEQAIQDLTTLVQEVDDDLDEVMGENFDSDTDSLRAIRERVDATDETPQEIADAVWNAPVAGHSIDGTMGEALVIESAKIDAIQERTNLLPDDPASTTDVIKARDIVSGVVVARTDAVNANTDAKVAAARDAVLAAVQGVKEDTVYLITVLDATKTVVDAIRSTDVPAILSAISAARASIESILAVIEGPGFNGSTDSMEKIRDAIDALRVVVDSISATITDPTVEFEGVDPV